MISLLKSIDIPLVPAPQIEHQKQPLSHQWDNFLNGKRKYLSIVGGCAINSLIGGYIGVGNMIPYLASYLTAMVMDPSATVCTADIRTSFASNMTLCNWMLAALTIGYASFGTVGGLLNLYVSTRVVAFLGGSVVVSSFVITSFYTANIFIMMFCSFGVLYGVGIGLMWSPAISCVMRWFPQSKALMSGALLSAVNVGTISLSILETEHINPSNVYNDPGCGYSLHRDVVARVPGTFTLLAVLAMLCTLMGFLFLFDKQDANDTINDHTTSTSTSISDGDALDVTITNPEGVIMAEMNADKMETKSRVSLRQYTVPQALRTYQFWIITCNVMLSVFPLSFVYSDWKLFAQNYVLIGDDQFLLSLNMAAAISGVCGRFFWGAFYDWTGSYRVTMLSLASVTTTTIATLPLCPTGNKAMVSIWICMLWFCVSAAYTLFPPALSNNFGDKYCGVLMGFVIISETVATMMQSGFFTVFHSSGMSHNAFWTLLCLEQALFMVISVLITIRFKATKR